MHTREPTTETKILINSKKNPKRFSYNHFEDLRKIARNDSKKGRNQGESQPQSLSPSPSLSQLAVAVHRPRQRRRRLARNKASSSIKTSGRRSGGTVSLPPPPRLQKEPSGKRERRTDLDVCWGRGLPNSFYFQSIIL